MEKVFFFIPDLNGGGAERALVNLLTNWSGCDSCSVKPVLVVRRWQGEYTSEIPDALPRLILNLERSGLRATVSTVIKLGMELRRHKPAAIVIFLSAPAIYLAARIFHPSCKIILSLQTSPAQWLENERDISKGLVRIIQGFVFRHADFLLPISEGIARELRELYGLSGSTIKVIHNSVNLEIIDRESAGDFPPEMICEEGTFRIITAGRLVRQKTQEVLIKAVADLVNAGKKVELFVLGQGPDKRYLEDTAHRLGIGKRVHFLGFQKNPWRFFRNADFFALSSKFEGFANVIIEAMACGLPVISTDAPHGPREILKDGKYGMLVPVGDSDAMARAIMLLMENEEVKQEYVGKSLRRARDFDINGISATFSATITALLCSDKFDR